jgi:hypothetical protein
MGREGSGEGQERCSVLRRGGGVGIGEGRRR